MDMENTIAILRLRRRQAYLQGVINGIEQLESDLIKSFEGEEVDVPVPVYMVADNLASHFIFELEQLELEIEEKLEKEKDNG